VRVIIAGSRGITDYGYVEEAVDASGFDITEVVSGTAAGVDRLGEEYAEDYDLPVKRFPVDWSNIRVPGAVVKRNRHGEYNAIAGHQRNKKMGDYADALIAIWDGQSLGTMNMINYMASLGKPFFVYNISAV